MKISVSISTGQSFMKIGAFVSTGQLNDGASISKGQFNDNLAWKLVLLFLKDNLMTILHEG